DSSAIFYRIGMGAEQRAGAGVLVEELLQAKRDRFCFVSAGEATRGLFNHIHYVRSIDRDDADHSAPIIMPIMIGCYRPLRNVFHFFPALLPAPGKIAGPDHSTGLLLRHSA